MESELFFLLAPSCRCSTFLLQIHTCRFCIRSRPGAPACKQQSRKCLLSLTLVAFVAVFASWRRGRLLGDSWSCCVCQEGVLSWNESRLVCCVLLVPWILTCVWSLVECLLYCNNTIIFVKSIVPISKGEFKLKCIYFFIYQVLKILTQSAQFAIFFGRCLG